MHRNTMRENRETPLLPVRLKKLCGPVGESQKHESYMHGSGESYIIVVPAKQPNEGGTNRRRRLRRKGW